LHLLWLFQCWIATAAASNAYAFDFFCDEHNRLQCAR